jgi:hypothetical protein
MKGLLLFAIVGILGYYGYHYWLAAPEPPPPPPPPVPAAKVVEAKPEPVNFAVKSRVRKLFEEWKRRNLGNAGSQLGSATVDPGSELTEIRKTLFRDGVHSEAAVLDVIKRALRELGVAEKEINEVAAGILGMR